MIYSLTDKLSFDENPQIEIKGKTITVKAEAETALRLLDMLDKEGELSATVKALDILFSAKDRKVISDMKLSMHDYTTLISTAIDLCLGNDPDADKESE